MLIDKNGNCVDEAILNKEKIVFYGASTRNKAAIEKLGIKNHTAFFVDSNKQRVGELCDGYFIRQVDELSEGDYVIVSTLAEHVKDVVQAVSKYNITKIYFYVSDEVEFDIEFVRQKNREALESGDYKYIHIFPGFMFMKYFYQMIEENFNISEHLFIMDYTSKNDQFKIRDYIYEMMKKNSNIMLLDDVHQAKNVLVDMYGINSIFYETIFEQKLGTAEEIVIHSARWGSECKRMLLGMEEKSFKKSILISFGRDYDFTTEDVETVILRKVKYVVISRNSQIEKFERLGAKVRMGEALYSYISCKEKQTEKKYDKEERIILLGHAAHEFVDHNLGLHMLEKFKEDNILIYCPLSYGNREYAKRVIEAGKEIFGEKFIPMTEFMTSEEYYSFLRKVDAAVYPIEVICAGTTIRYLHALGKKIYVKTKIKNSEWNIASSFIDINNIQHLSLEEFFASGSSKEENDKIKELNSIVIERWKQILIDAGGEMNDTI